MIGRAGRLTAGAVALIMAACGVSAPPRPAGTPVADPAATAALLSATPHCRPLRTVTLALRLSGRAGPERIGARLVVGFAEPTSIRLEALAPFGPPAMILVSDGEEHTLLFPRDRQVLRGAAVADVLDALTGLPFDAAELRRLVLGCLVPANATGERFGDAWQVVADQGTRIYLRRGVLVAADHRGWQVDYAAHQGGIARQVRLRRTADGPPIDLTATLSELEINIGLAPAAFTLDVPTDAEPLTLDDLRRASPLRAR